MPNTGKKQKRRYLTYCIMALTSGGIMLHPGGGWAAVATNATPSEEAAAISDDMSTYTLDDVIVTATRNQADSQKVPASVTVITGEQLIRQNAVTVTDALRNVAGIFVDRARGLADVANGISMRGFGESNILVLYDGMPMNTAYDGSVDWASIPVANVERIEIVRGAGSSLYGGRAVGGVINIISKQPAKNLKVTTGLVYGSNGTWRKNILVGEQASEKFGFTLGYEQDLTTGFQNKFASSTGKGSTHAVGPVGTGVVTSQTVDGRPRYIIGTPGNSGGRNNTYTAKMKYDFDSTKSLTYSYTHDEFRYWSDSPQTYIHDAAGNALFTGSVKLPNGRYYNFDESAFTDYYGRRDTDVHSLRYADTANKVIFTLGVSDIKDAGYAQGDFFAGNTPGTDTAYPSTSYKADFQKTWEPIGKHTLTAGFDLQKDDMTRTGRDLAHWHEKDSVLRTRSQMGGKDELYALFVQDEYQWSSQLKLYTGIRFDHYRKYGGYAHDDIKNSHTAYKEASYNQISPKLALEYDVKPGMVWYASYGHSFNSPSLYKLYRTDSYYDANPDLKPENSNTFEIGIKNTFARDSKMNLAFYQTRTNDLINTERVAGSSKRRYVNIDQATRTGIELDLTHQYDQHWSQYLNYNWEKIYDGDDQPVYGMPKHILHTGVTYRQGKWATNLDLEYVSNRNEAGECSGVYLSNDPILVWNLGIHYKFDTRTSAFFTIDNVMDRSYYQWYKAAGRTYTLGVQMEL